MFIGEGPGRNEDLEGRPFVGRAGQFLEECLASIGLRKDAVFICNVVKCRPIERSAGTVRDRKPTEDEIDACSPYLDHQIRLLKPRIICTLGDTATAHVFKRYGLKVDTIGRIHGRAYQVGELTIIPLYHPAAALYAAPLKDTILADFRRLRELLKERTLDSFAGP
jgi:DNA polymerase